MTLTMTVSDELDGTMYWLWRDGECIAGHPWPWVLERFARGRVERLEAFIEDAPAQSLGLPSYTPEYEPPDLDVQAEDWLERELVGGPVPCREIEARSRAAGISSARLRAAAKRIPIVRKRVWGQRRGMGRHRGSHIAWSLPGSIEEEVVLEIEVNEFVPVAEPAESLEQELNEAAAAVASPERCKAPGCAEEAVGKASFKGLCEKHVRKEAQRRNRKGSASKRAAKVEPEPQQLVALGFDDVLEQLVHAREEWLKAENELRAMQELVAGLIAKLEVAAE